MKFNPKSEYCCWFGCGNEVVERELYSLLDGNRIWLSWCEKHAPKELGHLFLQMCGLER